MLRNRCIFVPCYLLLNEGVRFWNSPGRRKQQQHRRSCPAKGDTQDAATSSKRQEPGQQGADRPAVRLVNRISRRLTEQTRLDRQQRQPSTPLPAAG